MIRRFKDQITITEVTVPVPVRASIPAKLRDNTNNNPRIVAVRLSGRQDKMIKDTARRLGLSRHQFMHQAAVQLAEAIQESRGKHAVNG